VPNATDTLITFANQALGDVTNGLEVQVDAACGAVTTKNFHFTEWQVEEGPAITAFGRRPFEQELRDCQRFFETGRSSQQQQTVTAGVTINVGLPFKQTKRAPPTMGSTINSQTNASSSVATTLDASSFIHQWQNTSVSGSSTDSDINWTASADL
jgi:hypothetical protein